MIDLQPKFLKCFSKRVKIKNHISRGDKDIEVRHIIFNNPKPNRNLIPIEINQFIFYYLLGF